MAGLLLPLAYAPVNGSGSTALPVLDCLLTGCLSPGTQLNFRFYPQDQSYQSPLSVLVPFLVGPQLLTAGTFVRLTWDGVTTLQFQLAARTRGGSWAPAALSNAPQVGFSSTASCFVFLGGGGVPFTPLTAIGLSLPSSSSPPLLPPPAVLPCQYAFARQAVPPLAALAYFSGNLQVGAPSPADLAVPGSWAAAWQLLQWTNGWAAADAATGFLSIVDATEDALYVRMTAGQLLPVAFSPYDPVAAPGVPGAAGFVVAQTLPPSTTVLLWCNAWSARPSPGTAYHYAWTSSPAGDTPAGTVVTLRGLGGAGSFALSATTGLLSPGTVLPPAEALTCLTLFCASGADGPYPVTALPTCAYADEVPAGLVPGLNMRATPWPAYPAFALGCGAGPSLLAAPLRAWIDQCPLPSTVPVKT